MHTHIFRLVATGCTLFWANAALATTPQRVLDSYYSALGGRSALKAVNSISLVIVDELRSQQQKLTLSADGRLRIEEDNGVVIHDGKQFWRRSHGLVGSLKKEDLRPTPATFSDILMQGLPLDQVPSDLSYGGTTHKHGRAYHQLLWPQKKRTYLFDKNTGLLHKIIEKKDDEKLGQLVVVYRFADYIQVDTIRLPSRREAICITTGDEHWPPQHLKSITLNPTLPENAFAKPKATAPLATVSNNAVKALVLGMSERGSVITNITPDTLQQLGITDGAIIEVRTKNQSKDFQYRQSLYSGGSIERGQLIASFYQPPALWLIKAYQNLSDDHKITKGDSVTILLKSTPKKSAGDKNGK